MHTFAPLANVPATVAGVALGVYVNVPLTFAVPVKEYASVVTFVPTNCAFGFGLRCPYRSRSER